MEMEWSANRKLPLPTIIAMQGDPFTGKTTISKYLAKKLRCSTIGFLDIVNGTISSGDHPWAPENVEAAMSQAFEIITRIVKTQISLGLSIIVNSPLSRHHHLEKLVGLTQGPHSREKKQAGVKLIIIECKPRVKYAWQMKLEERHAIKTNQKWPMESEFGRDYSDDDIHSWVSKLIIDITEHVPLSLIVEAVHDLARDTEGQRIEFNKWRLIHHHNVNLQRENTKQDRLSQRRFWCSPLCRTKHFITVYKEGGIDYDATCAVCQKQVTKSTESVYACSNCPLAIHKSCAELDGEGNKTVFTPESFPKFFERGPEATYCFPEQHSCIHCREQSKQFSYDCEACIFESHLKCRLVPTILRHQAHDHFLFFLGRSISKKAPFLCGACRLHSDLVCGVAYCCVECMVYYHPECALMPALVRDHKHGGYIHDLELIIRREKELEDYICDMCFEKTNPTAWYYYCKICLLSLHLDCAFRDFDA